MLRSACQSLELSLTWLVLLDLTWLVILLFTLWYHESFLTFFLHDPFYFLFWFATRGFVWNHQQFIICFCIRILNGQSWKLCSMHWKLGYFDLSLLDLNIFLRRSYISEQLFIIAKLIFIFPSECINVFFIFWAYTLM